MNENIVKINKILENENTQLKSDNKVLGSELTYFREYAADLEEEVNSLKNRCRILSDENLSLKSEIKDMKFTRKYLTSRDVGETLARELLGKTMTHEDLAIEAAENAYEPYNGDDF